MPECDPSAVPALAALLGHPDPKVRYFAVQKLVDLKESVRPALPLLRGMAQDQDEIVPDVTVGDAALQAVNLIDADATDGAPQP